MIVLSCGQSALINELEKQRLEIEGHLKKSNDSLIILAKVSGEPDLQKVIDKNWPEDIETTCNVLKNQNGKSFTQKFIKE